MYGNRSDRFQGRPNSTRPPTPCPTSMRTVGELRTRRVVPRHRRRGSSTPHAGGVRVHRAVAPSVRGASGSAGCRWRVSMRSVRAASRRRWAWRRRRTRQTCARSPQWVPRSRRGAWNHARRRSAISDELVTARDALVKELTAALNRQKHVRHRLLRRQLKNRLAQIDRQIKALDDEIAEVAGADAELSRRIEVLTSIPGVASGNAGSADERRRSGRCEAFEGRSRTGR